MRLHLTIHIHYVNDWLELIFCGVLSEWPHKVPQLFSCNKSTVVLVEVLKSIPVICKKTYYRWVAFRMYKLGVVRTGGSHHKIRLIKLLYRF